MDFAHGPVPAIPARPTVFNGQILLGGCLSWCGIAAQPPHMLPYFGSFVRDTLSVLFYSGMRLLV